MYGVCQSVPVEMSASLLFRVTVPNETSILKVLSKVIDELHVKNPIWVEGFEEASKQKFKQVLFYLENGHETEKAITLLTENDIGVTPNSSIGLFQCYLLYQGSKQSSPQIKVTSPQDDSYSWEKFMESVRPRLAIAQIIESVKCKASLTFDFVVLLIVAALTASLGLVEDSQLILAASMLISPMMFPMIAATFGTVIRQWKLQKQGIANGLLGLLVCLIIGFLFGIAASIFQGYKTMNEWPTSLMYSMGTMRSLWTGAILAILSGIAVSICILGEDAGSIHGVAISAALLPPAVNAGLLWSRSALLTTFPGLPDNSRQIWSMNPQVELALLGTISLILSLLNVIFIFIAGNLLFTVKEVASGTQIRDTHWKNLREFKPFTKEETDHITVRLGINGAQDFSTHHWTVMPNEFHRKKAAKALETWSGSSRCSEKRPTVQDLAHHMLAPRKIMALRKLAKDISAAQESGNSLTPSSVAGSEQGYSTTPPSSRFTVVPVYPS